MGAIRALCRDGVLLEQGTVAESGDVGASIESYYRLLGALKNDGSDGVEGRGATTGFGPVTVNGTAGSVCVSQDLPFEAVTTLRVGENTSGFYLFLTVKDMQSRFIFQLRETGLELGITDIRAGRYDIRVKVPPLWLNPGLYSMHFKVVFSGDFMTAKYLSDEVPLDVEGTSSSVDGAILHPRAAWQLDRH